MSEAALSAQTRASLLIRLRDPHDADAWRMFVETYGPIIFRHCRSKSLQFADASDVTQEVLIQVVRSIRQFVYEPEKKGRFRDWLWTVTSRQLMRFYGNRHQNQFECLDEDRMSADLCEAADSGWNAELNTHLLDIALKRIRSSFESMTWRAFELVWLMQRSPALVAQELGISIEKVYVAKSRVLKRLADEVRFLSDDLPQFFRMD